MIKNKSFPAFVVFPLGLICVIFIAGITYFSLLKLNPSTLRQENTAKANNTSATTPQNTTPQNNQNQNSESIISSELRGIVSEINENSCIISIESENSEPRTVNVQYSENTSFVSQDTATPPNPGNNTKQETVAAEKSSIIVGSIIVVESGQEVTGETTTVNAIKIINLL